MEWLPEKMVLGTLGGGQTRAERQREFTFRFLYCQQNRWDIAFATLPEDGWSLTANAEEGVDIRAPERQPSRMTWTRAYL
jgi:hypothetical protein